MPLTPLVREIADARARGASPRDLARLLRTDTASIDRDPVEFRFVSDPIEKATLRAGTTSSDDSGDERPIVKGTTSSTDIDLYGTRMKPSAINSMQASAQDNLVVFLNHSYTIPEDLFGSVTEATKHRRRAPDGQTYTDLDLVVGVVPEDVNPRAMASWRSIKANTKLGFSIGALVLDWQWETPDGEKIDVDEDDWWSYFFGPTDDAVMALTDVLLLESSLVGIPANRRSWVAQSAAARAIRAAGRALGMDQRPSGLIVPAGTPTATEERQMPESRTAPPRQEPPARVRRDAADGDGGAEESEREKAKTAQEERSKKYGIGIKEDTNVTKPSEWTDVPDDEWADPVNYKMPMPDKNHADNAASRWDDQDVRDEYTKAEQDIISTRIEDRQKHFGEDGDDKEQDGKDGKDGKDGDKRSADDANPYTVPVTPDVSGAGSAPSVEDLERGLGYTERQGDDRPTETPVAPAPVAPGGRVHEETRSAEAGSAETETPAQSAASPADPTPADLFLRAVRAQVEAITRAGGEYSQENAGHLVTAHDALAHALNMRCCGMDGCDGHAGERDYSGRAGDDGDGDTDGDADGDDAQGMGDDARRALLADLRAEVAAARSIRADLIAEIRALDAQRTAATADLAAAHEAIRAADARGLGRPTQQAGTAIHRQYTDEELARMTPDEAYAVLRQMEGHAGLPADAERAPA